MKNNLCDTGDGLEDAKKFLKDLDKNCDEKQKFWNVPSAGNRTIDNVAQDFASFAAIFWSQWGMDESKKSLAESTEKKAASEGDLKVTSKDLSEDVTALGDPHQDCMTKDRGADLKDIRDDGCPTPSSCSSDSSMSGFSRTQFREKQNIAVKKEAEAVAAKKEMMAANTKRS